MVRPLLVVIGYVWPEPNSSAAGSRILNIIDFFRGHDWEIIFASAAAISEHRFDLASMNVSEKTILLNDSSFDEWIKSVSPSVVLFDRFFTEEQFGWRVENNCPNAVRVLDTEDFHGLRKARQNMLKNNLLKINQELKQASSQDLGVVQVPSGELFEIMIEDEAVQRELASLLRCDLSLMVSRYEIELLTVYFKIPSTQLFYLPLLIDPSTLNKSGLAFAQRKNFVAMGNFRHDPNWDSVQILKSWIWPALRKKCLSQGVSAELHIYGAYPPPKATELNNLREGFLVKGWAADANEVLGLARVCLAPLRFGAGQKGKLISAMQMGTPSVTTSIGAEGMYSPEAKCGAIANELANFVDAALNLYLSENDWLEAQEAGFNRLENHFLSEHYAESFWNRIQDLLGNLTRRRKSNVMGILLRQQLHRATQYMGQWIEEKNRTKE